MKRIIPISRLDRVIAVLDGSAQLESPFDVRNLRLQGYDCYMRYGYTNKAAKQAGFVDEGAYGLGWFEGVSQITGQTKPSRKEYFLTIENTGSIRPYLRNINSVTNQLEAPVQIGTTTLINGYWNFASYNDCVYAIRPEADEISPTPQPTVYKHLLGETTGDEAWVAVQDSDYLDPGDPIDLTTNFIVPNTLSAFIDPATSLDTYSITNVSAYHPGTITKTYNSNGSLLLNGPSNDTGGDNGGWLYIEQTFGTAIDFTGADYLFMNLQAENYMNFFTTVYAYTNPFQLKIGGVWTNVVDRKWSLSVDRRQATWMIYTKGMTLTAVQGIRFNISCKPGRGASAGPAQNIVTISPLKYGGYYTESTLATQRAWDTNLVGDGVTYGARFSNGVATHSAIEEITFSKAQITANTTGASYANYPGTKLQLISTAPSGAYNRVQFLRRDDSVSPPVWKIIDTKTTSPYTTIDTYREMDISALITASTAVIGKQTPAFRTSGIVGAFAYKQSVVWLIGTTYQNLQFSRVGNPLELWDADASLEYGDDVTQPAQFTLADDQADVPVWGTQSGQIAFIIGKSAAYAMVGDYPSTMSPSRQIPGSRGIAGYYAGTRFRSSQGVWGAAYADTDLNVWVVNSVPQFVGDASVQPQELSMPVRGKLRQFLFEEQKLQLPNITIQDVKLAFQESTSSLWVVLGKRAAVYRQDMVGTGWELYDYTMSSDIAVATCTPYFTNGAIAHDHNGGDSTWSNFGFPFASDDSYCLNAFGLPSSASSTVARMTKQLRCHSYLPIPLIPTNATITNVRWKVEDSKVGDLQVTQTLAYPTVNGSTYGSNLSTNRIVTTSDAEQVYNLASPLPSIANINAGHLGIDLQYTQEVWNTNWNDPDNYDITVSSETPIPEVSCTHTITVTYTHGGTPPPYAYIDITSFVEAYLAVINNPALPIPWSATQVIADNGIDNIVQGTASVDTLNPPVTVISNSTKRVKVMLTSGVGSNAVNASVSGTIVLPNPNTNDSIGVIGNFSASATFSPVVPSTVRVDNVAVQVCYTVISTGTNIQWSRLAFSPNDKYVAFRSSGELDVIERDAFTSGFPFIGGTNRDSGLTPPSWYFTTQQIQWDGAKARLASVQYHGQNYNDLIQMSVSVDNGSFVNGTLAGLNTSRWYGWHPNVSSGMRHSIKFEGSETDASLKGMAFEFNVQSKGKPK
jgi:hypothetical protein